MKIRSAAAALVVAFTLTACATGKRMDSGQLADITPGKTTRADLVAQFGEPRAVGIQDGKPAATWVHAYAGPFGAGSKIQQLVATFNADGTVATFTTADPYAAEAKPQAPTNPPTKAVGGKGAP